MSRANLLGILGGSVLLLLAQLVLFKSLVLFGSAFCFAYVLIFLLIPIDVNSLVQLIIGFFIGIIVDSFYNTLGIHAAASVMFMYARIYWVHIITPAGTHDVNLPVNLRINGLGGVIMYSFPLILLHSLLLFFIEASGFYFFWQTFSKALCSACFTLVVVLIIQYLFYKKIK